MEDFIWEIQDFRHLNWSDTKLSPGTPGCFLKAYEEQNGQRYYYKLSNYDSYRGVFGHECINELIVSRLLEILQIPHLHYQLLHALICIDGKEMDTYITRSKNFRKEDERKMPFEVFYDLHRQQAESPLDFFIRMGWSAYLYQMLTIDYLICNRDRHGANIEILIDGEDQVRPAPLFDQGISLLFSCYGNIESIRKYDILEDKAVNNFIGSKSSEYNLRFIPKGLHWFDGRLREHDREKLLSGLDGVLHAEHLEKIWNMLWKRWERYVQICGEE